VINNNYLYTVAESLPAEAGLKFLAFVDYVCHPVTTVQRLMKQTPRISEAEWVVMRVAWRRAPLSARDIVEEVCHEQDWHPKTVKTLLNRLIKKGALGFEKEGRAYLYYPRVREADCVAAAGDSFLERVFGGALQPMLAHFVKRKPLSAEEAKQLKRILEQSE